MTILQITSRRFLNVSFFVHCIIEISLVAKVFSYEQSREIGILPVNVKLMGESLFVMDVH